MQVSSNSTTLIRNIFNEVHENIKMTICWDVSPCSLVEIDRRFRGPYCLHHQEVVSSFEMSVNFYETTRRNIPEDSHLHTRRRENSQLGLQENVFSCSVISFA
jgi:hypothetical protein